MKIYTVRPGDTMAGIGASCGMSAKELAAYNALSDPARISRGMALLLPDRDVEPSPREAELLAFACPGVSQNTLKNTGSLMTFMCVHYTGILPDGILSVPRADGMIEAAVAGGAIPLLTVGNTYSETGGFLPNTAHRLFTDDGVRERFAESLIASLDEGGFMGALFHFHYLFPFDREAYGSFLTEISRLLHSGGFYVLASLAPCRSGGEPGLSGWAHDFQTMAGCCDRLILLCGELGDGGEPEAAMPRLRETLERALDATAPGKLLMELPRRARDTVFSPQGGMLPRSLSYATAADLAAATDARPRYDPLLASSIFTYADPAGIEHRVWYEDARGICARLKLVGEYNLAGAALSCDNNLYPPMLEILDSMFSPEKLI